jgi:hypothetical protein
MVPARTAEEFDGAFEGVDGFQRTPIRRADGATDIYKARSHAVVKSCITGRPFRKLELNLRAN